MRKLRAALLAIQTILLALLVLNTLPHAQAGDAGRLEVVLVKHAINRFHPLPVEVVGEVRCK